VKIAGDRAKKSTRRFASRPLGRTPVGVTDILFIAITAAFIAVCVGYVRWCDRIIGPDDFGTPEPEATVTGATIDASAGHDTAPESQAVPA
jgi:hypothetical protein